MSLPILHDDPHLVAVAKPPDLATVPGRGETDSVLQHLARQLGLPCTGQCDPRLRPVHRLDKQTSGVLLFARHRDAQRHLSHQFQNNTVQKEYLALVAGRPGAQEGQIDSPLAPDPRSPRRMRIDRHGRPARTLWRLDQFFPAANVALLRVWPRTGKTHQVRVHLRSIGLPLAVDQLYSPPAPGQVPGLFLSRFKRGYHRSTRHEERPLIARLTLHAHTLRFLGLDGNPLEITAPLPRDFRAAINMLTKYGGIAGLRH